MHDAHAPAHHAVLVEGNGVLVGGDMLSDVELPMPAAGDTTLERYVTGLESLREAVGRSTLVIPGHGTPARDPMARFDADRRYLDDVISGRASDDPRIADPENASLHAANLERAALTRERRTCPRGRSPQPPPERAERAGGRGRTRRSRCS